MKRRLLGLGLGIALWILPVYSAEVVTWDTLGTLDYQTGKVSDKLDRLRDQEVEVTGFIVPLELDGSIETVTEFILVPNPLACIHVPPPPPNQMIYVKMAYPIPLDMDFRGVTIKGTLSIPRPKTEEGMMSFEIAGSAAAEADIEVIDPFNPPHEGFPDDGAWTPKI